MIKFEILGEPKGKGRPRFRSFGKFVKTYTDEATVSYENLVRLSYQAQCEEAYLDGQALECNVRIYQGIPKSTSKKQMNLMLEDKVKPTKKPDVDNILKSLFDGLNKVAYKDDTQIVKVMVEKYYALDPRVEMEIKEINND